MLLAEFKMYGPNVDTILLYISWTPFSARSYSNILYTASTLTHQAMIEISMIDRNSLMF